MAPPLQGAPIRQGWIFSSFWTRQGWAWTWLFIGEYSVISTWSLPLDLERVENPLTKGKRDIFIGKAWCLEVLSPFCHRCPVRPWHWGLTVPSLPPRSTTQHTSYICKDDKCKSKGLGAFWEDKETLDSLEPKSVHIYQIMQKLKKVHRKWEGIAH